MYAIKRCNIVVTSKPWICGVLQTRMISACKTNSSCNTCVWFELHWRDFSKLIFWQTLNMCKISSSYDGAFFLALFMICMQQYSACRFMLLWHVQWERFTHMEQVDYSDLLDWCWSCVCKCQIVNGHSEWWFVVQNSSKLMSVCCFCCMNDLVLVQTCTVQILWKMNLDQYLWHSPKCCSINLA